MTQFQTFWLSGFLQNSLGIWTLIEHRWLIKTSYRRGWAFCHTCMSTVRFTKLNRVTYLTLYPLGTLWQVTHVHCCLQKFSHCLILFFIPILFYVIILGAITFKTISPIHPRRVQWKYFNFISFIIKNT